MNIPKPESFRRFMFYCGPVLFTTAMGLGTSEVILYPHLTAKYGTGWLGWIVLALFFQTVWGMELARWVVVSGEHGVRANARIISRPGAAILITLMMFIGLVIPVWATAAASALWEVLRFPADIKTATVFWAVVTFALVFALIFFSRIARKWAEIIASASLILSWIILVIAVFYGISGQTARNIADGLVNWNIPYDIDIWVFGSTVAWVGTGPGLLWYTYWMRDAGWGMARYAEPIPGWFGESKEYKAEGVLPDDDSPENVANLKTWLRRSHWTIWLGYFLGSLVTILIFVGLSDSLLRPRGLVPQGFEVVRHQAQFFVPVCGSIGCALFLMMAWLLFFNTQIGMSESLVRQNADATTTLFGINIKRSYFIWWAVYLAISFGLVILLVYRKDLTIFKYITYSAMTSAVALVVSMAVTLIGTFTLYRKLPPRIRKAASPSPVWKFILALGVAYHIFWLGWAAISKI
ncbi:MAG: Nramp family divalent metal transporter [Planctomycetota bacterium]